MRRPLRGLILGGEELEQLLDVLGIGLVDAVEEDVQRLLADVVLEGLDEEAAEGTGEGADVVGARQALEELLGVKGVDVAELVGDVAQGLQDRPGFRVVVAEEEVGKVGEVAGAPVDEAGGEV